MAVEFNPAIALAVMAVMKMIHFFLSDQLCGFCACSAHVSWDRSSLWSVCARTFSATALSGVSVGDIRTRMRGVF